VGRRAWLRSLVSLLAVVILTAGCEYITNASRTCRTGGTHLPAFSRDGRYVAFESVCTRDTVVGGPLAGFPSDGTPPWTQVYVRDLATGDIEGVSYAYDGGSGDYTSTAAHLSGDGRKVVFDSLADDLVPNDGNGVADVFVRDLTTDVTSRVSVSAAGGDANGSSFAASISDDGNIVAFSSSATNLVPGGGSGTRLYVRDLAAGTTTLVPLPPIQMGHASSVTISPDGRYLAFLGYPERIYVHDLQLGTTTQVSVDRTGGDPNSSSWSPSISAGGRYVAFVSSASDLVGGDNNGMPDVFVRDMQTATTRRLRDASGGDPNGWAHSVAINRDGRFVAFASDATDMVTTDVHGIRQIYIRDVFSGRTSVGSADKDGNAATVQSPQTEVAISGDGRYVAFVSADHSLDGSNDDAYLDVFVRFTTRPVVSSATPASVARGSSSTLTVTGAGFFSNTRVSFGGQGLQVTSTVYVNATTLHVSVSAAANAATGARDVSAANPGTGPGPTSGSSGDACAGCLTVT
jgi:Tol biopolymer transport system component